MRGKLNLWTAQWTGSTSIAAATSNPACSKPRLSPPAPAKEVDANRSHGSEPRSSPTFPETPTRSSRSAGRAFLLPRKSRRHRAKVSRSVVSHSHITNTFHPIARNSSSFRPSRFLIPVEFRLPVVEARFSADAPSSSRDRARSIRERRSPCAETEKLHRAFREDPSDAPDTCSRGCEGACGRSTPVPCPES